MENEEEFEAIGEYEQIGGCDGEDFPEDYGSFQGYDDAEEEGNEDEEDNLAQSEVDKIANKLLSRMDMEYNVSAKAMETPSTTTQSTDRSAAAEEVTVIDKPVFDIKVVYCIQCILIK